MGVGTGTTDQHPAGFGGLSLAAFLPALAQIGIPMPLAAFFVGGLTCPHLKSGHPMFGMPETGPEGLKLCCREALMRYGSNTQITSGTMKMQERLASLWLEICIFSPQTFLG